MPAAARRRADDGFEFVAIGDTPYTRGDRSRFERLARHVNDLRPAFVAHLGDVQEGGTKASPRRIQRIADVLGQLEGPLIYTPGDNDWSDTKPNQSGFGPADMLAGIRKAFFGHARTLGSKTFRVTRQADGDPDFAAYTENIRFAVKDVVFVVIHVVGRDAAADGDADSQQRCEASLAWLHAGFDEAARGGRGLVVMTHANLLYYAHRQNRRGFEPLLEALGRRAQAFAKPVWIIHGDKHEFMVDRPPLPHLAGLANVHRVQVMGGRKNVHGVLVRVDSRSPDLLIPEALLVPENLRGRGLYRGPQP